MYKKKPFFITFEGIEGSGKSYQSKKLYKNLIKQKISAVYTREPGGSKSAEKIRKFLLTGKKNKFNKITDTLLYMASRSEHFENLIKPSLKKNKVIICDRFIDSTMAYQASGKGINKDFINVMQKNIVGNLKPNLTFILKLNPNIALSRVKKRSTKNRYDKFKKEFYKKVQNAYIKFSKSNKKRYIIIDSSKNQFINSSIILKKTLLFLNK